MRNYFKTLLLLIIIFSTAACGDSPVKKMSKLVSGNKESTSKTKEKNKDKSAFSKIKEGTKAVKNYSKIASNAEKAIDQMNKLAELEPVTQAALKSWLPENMDNYKRTYYSTGEMAAAGIISFKSKFTNQDEKDKVVNIEVTDGAGSGIAGMLISGLQRNFETGFEEETETGYKRVVERKGMKAMEEQNNKYKSSSLEYIENDRFHIKLKGKNISADELWEIAEKLHTDKLNQL